MRWEQPGFIYRLAFEAGAAACRRVNLSRSHAVMHAAIVSHPPPDEAMRRGLMLHPLHCVQAQKFCLERQLVEAREKADGSKAQLAAAQASAAGLERKFLAERQQRRQVTSVPFLLLLSAHSGPQGGGLMVMILLQGQTFQEQTNATLS